MLLSIDIVIEARSWIGTPFKHQGRAKGVGVDCIGLVICVAKELQLAANYVEEPYGRMPNGYRMQQGLLEWCDAVDGPYPGALDSGDVVLMTWRRWPLHAGIIAEHKGYKTIIHSYSGFPACTEHRLDDEWCGRITHAFRYSGVADG